MILYARREMWMTPMSFFYSPQATARTWASQILALKIIICTLIATRVNLVVVAFNRLLNDGQIFDLAKLILLRDLNSYLGVIQ